MSWQNKESKIDYTGASAQEYTDAYTNRPEDAGNLEGIQGLLSKIGMAPGIGEPADLLNALLYGMQGEGKQAGLSALSMLPFLGGTIGARKLSKIPSRQGSTVGAGKRGDTMFPSEDTYETAVPRAEEYYQGIPAGSGGEGYFKSLLDDLFDSFKGKEF